jgi:hypothetical protein
MRSRQEVDITLTVGAWRGCIPMGSDGVFSKRKIGMAGLSPPRKWPSPLLSEELSLQTLADTTYVRLMHPDDVMSMCSEGYEHDAAKGTRAGAAWSWLKRPVTWNGRDFKETVQLGLAKSKSHNTWAWLARPPADEFQFDPTKRWPQGW